MNKKFDPNKALAATPEGRRNQRSRSCFDHPRIQKWLEVWVPARNEGRLTWTEVLELVHQGCEAEGIPFPDRGDITYRALSNWVRKI